jgi:hypothetical protein
MFAGLDRAVLFFESPSADLEYGGENIEEVKGVLYGLQDTLESFGNYLTQRTRIEWSVHDCTGTFGDLDGVSDANASARN